VPCPLRGECILEGVVCSPEFNSKISDSEMRVLELLYKGYDKEEIAEKLFLSVHTVNNHIRNAYVRLGFREKAEFIDYAHRNKLFKDE
jgi:DNA-binding NarL/FixJ family response regulator